MMMRKLFCFVALSALLLGCASEQVNKVSGFEIHILDVGQAMCQVWIYPSGYTVFVDAPELHWNSGETAKVVAAKLDSILNGSKTFDVGVITHLHLDHIGYAGTGGLWALVEQYGYTFKKIIDRDSGRWVDKNNDGNCDNDEIVYNNVGTYSTTSVGWLCYATDPTSKVYKVREIAKLCSTTQINPPDKNAKVTIVAADAKGAKMQDGRNVQGDHHNESYPPSENDYSIGMVATYGDFTFSTFGDLDGEYAKSDHGYMYDDIEATVLKRICECDVYNVNHHGSSHSSSQDFLNKLKPTVSVISCGENNLYGHPAQEALDRISSVCDHIYITEKGNPDAQYGNAIITNDDVVITASGSGTYTVKYGNSVQTFNAKNANQPKCTQ